MCLPVAVAHLSRNEYTRKRIPLKFDENIVVLLNILRHFSVQMTSKQFVSRQTVKAQTISIIRFLSFFLSTALPSTLQNLQKFSSFFYSFSCNVSCIFVIFVRYFVFRINICVGMNASRKAPSLGSIQLEKKRKKINNE